MSEIRVDIIAEKTTANGVSVDGVSLKDGGATLADNLLFNASGKGVYLGATSATASNLLNDYEEGTFDPDLTFGGGNTGLTEFVEYNDEGNPDALHYGNMVSLAFKAIQELKADNDALRARIEALENA
jgi:hypothetical protein